MLRIPRVWCRRLPRTVSHCMGPKMRNSNPVRRCPTRGKMIRTGRLKKSCAVPFCDLVKAAKTLKNERQKKSNRRYELAQVRRQWRRGRKARSNFFCSRWINHKRIRKSKSDDWNCQSGWPKIKKVSKKSWGKWNLEAQAKLIQALLAAQTSQVNTRSKLNIHHWDHSAQRRWASTCQQWSYYLSTQLVKMSWLLGTNCNTYIISLNVNSIQRWLKRWPTIKTLKKCWI